MENPFEIINERLDRIEKLLINIYDTIDSNNKNYSKLPRIMNINQIASYLSLSKATIYGKVHRRDIPYFKRGKRLYFDKESINEWLRDGKIATMKDIEQKAADYIMKHPLKWR